VITEAPPESTAATDATFRFEASQRPLLGLPRFECQVDGAAWSTCTSPVELHGLGGGTHDFAVRTTGLLDDRTPDRRRWKVEQQTIVSPAPLSPSDRPPPPQDDEQPRHAAGGCDYGAATPGQASLPELRAATICLLNRERTSHGLRPVLSDPRLTPLAQRFAAELVDGRFFSHTSPGGRTLADRVHRSSYARGNAWEVGEILGWASGRRGTPHAQVLAWMHSPPHRAVVLGPAFRDVGVGVRLRTPRRGNVRGATYVGEFGHVG